MRTLAQKPKSNHSNKATDHSTTGRARALEDRNLNPVLRLQQTIGNQAVLQSMSLTPVTDQRLVQRTPDQAEALTSRHTTLGFLDEAGLGRELLRLALSGQLTLANEVFDGLGSTDRDDVAYEFMLRATDQQLVQLAATATSRQFLHRVFDELTSGSVASEEQQQADRILQITQRQTVSVAALDAASTSRQTKIFPFRLPGLTVLNDAPIQARRERGGVWVHSFVRVLGTSEFRAETSTLPNEYFLSGIVLPETEVIGVRLYDQGGIIHYTTPLFLIQLANATNQQTLEKILEAAGIGLTLGTGALAGLGFEASLAARVLLWADRAAFVLGTVTSVLREHRSWLVEHFGPRFMDAVDIVHSATAIYGFARIAIEAPRIILNLRNSYRAFREASRSRSASFSSAEQARIQQVTQSTDELIQQIDNIQNAHPPARAGGTEPTVHPTSTEASPTQSTTAGRPRSSETQPSQPSTPPDRTTERGREILEEFSEASRRGRSSEQPEGTHAVGERINPPTSAAHTEADILAANLTRELGPRPPGHHAHHIVPKGMAEAESAWDILEASHIGINDADNGVWLARDYGTPNPNTGEIHSTLHTRRYVRWITRELTEALNAGGPEAVRVRLAELRDIILNGRAIR